MMSFIHKIRLYLKTIRYLKLEQLFFQLYYRIVRRRAKRVPLLQVAGIFPKSELFVTGQQVWMGEKRFRFLNTEHDVISSADWNRSEWGKLWLYNLHYFDFLKQKNVSENIGNEWITRWIAENPAGKGNGWEPYPISLRIVNWIKWSLSGRTLSAKSLESLAFQVKFLHSRLERHLLANHYLANAKALVFAGMFFQGTEAQQWLSSGCEIYRKQLPEQILADGGHFERSPMYHSIILEDLLDLVNLNVPLFLEDSVTRMLKWLAVMTGPDEKIALLNDTAFDIALSPQQLFGYAEKLGYAKPEPIIESIHLANTGYARLTGVVWTLICDGAPIGPDYQPGHAHADTLTFELWHRNCRLLVDSGTGEYIDTPLRREQRSTAGHNTVVIDGRNSSEVWGAHRVAARAKIIERNFSEESFVAAHDGYAPIIHRREWRIQDGKVRIEDQISGYGEHQVESFWHFAPECRIETQGEALKIRLNNQYFLMTLPTNGSIDILSGHCSFGFGLTAEHPVIRWSGKLRLPLEVVTVIGEID